MRELSACELNDVCGGDGSDAAAFSATAQRPPTNGLPSGSQRQNMTTTVRTTQNVGASLSGNSQTGASGGLTISFGRETTTVRRD